jgi:hypothetical protein
VADVFSDLSLYCIPRFPKSQARDQQSKGSFSYLPLSPGQERIGNLREIRGNSSRQLPLQPFHGPQQEYVYSLKVKFSIPKMSTSPHRGAADSISGMGILVCFSGSPL